MVGLLLFLQNLFHLALPPAIGPTWSLAIEEQYYILWAPIVRLLCRPRWLALFLRAALIASPLFRMSHFAWITPTHTLTHIDGIAMGSLLAVGLHTLHWSRRMWLGLGLAGVVGGFVAAGTIAGGTAFLDTALTAGFAGRSAGVDCVDRRAQPRECSIAAGPAGLLRANQLRDVHDPHHGLHLLRMVRPEDGCAWHGRESCGGGFPAGGFHGGGHSALVRIRVADPQAEAVVCVKKQTKVRGFPPSRQKEVAKMGPRNSVRFGTVYRGQWPTMMNSASRNRTIVGVAGSRRRT